MTAQSIDDELCVAFRQVDTDTGATFRDDKQAERWSRNRAPGVKVSRQNTDLTR